MYAEFKDSLPKCKQYGFKNIFFLENNKCSKTTMIGWKEH